MFRIRFASFFLFINVSLFSLNMRIGVFLVFCCLIMFLLCALYVFSGIVDYVFNFSLWIFQIKLSLPCKKKKKKKKTSRCSYWNGNRSSVMQNQIGKQNLPDINDYNSHETSLARPARVVHSAYYGKLDPFESSTFAGYRHKTDHHKHSVPLLSKLTSMAVDLLEMFFSFLSFSFTFLFFSSSSFFFFLKSRLQTTFHEPFAIEIWLGAQTQCLGF